MSIGEQILNGGMELFVLDIPMSWTTTTPNLISKVTQQGRVHSGNSSVNLEGGANLAQTVNTLGGCYHEFSFFAHGEGANVSFTATATFITPGGSQIGATITVNEQDVPNNDREFAYYRVITTQAPSDVEYTLIRFEVMSNGNQSLDIDDVSFSVK